MPIDIALLGCAHPHVPDVLGVIASEPDLRLAAAWDADPSAIPVAIAGATTSRAEAAIDRAHAVVICPRRTSARRSARWPPAPAVRSWRRSR